MRWRSRGNPARPCIFLMIRLARVLTPSVRPLWNGRVSPASTAARSSSSPLAKEYRWGRSAARTVVIQSVSLASLPSVGVSSSATAGCAGAVVPHESRTTTHRRRLPSARRCCRVREQSHRRCRTAEWVRGPWLCARPSHRVRGAPFRPSPYGPGCAGHRRMTTRAMSSRAPLLTPRCASKASARRSGLWRAWRASASVRRCRPTSMSSPRRSTRPSV